MNNNETFANKELQKKLIPSISFENKQTLVQYWNSRKKNLKNFRFLQFEVANWSLLEGSSNPDSIYNIVQHLP